MSTVAILLSEAVTIIGRWILKLGKKLLHLVARKITRKLAAKNKRLRKRVLDMTSIHSNTMGSKRFERAARKLQRCESRLYGWRRLLTLLAKHEEKITQEATEGIDDYLRDAVADIHPDAFAVERQAARRVA